MEHITIKIQDKSNEQEPLLTNPENKKVVTGKVSMFGILEKGTKGGKATVSIIAEDDSTIVVLETTAALMHGCLNALQGAMERFGDI